MDVQNIFYGRKITKTFDLKGSLKGRFARLLQSKEGTIESTSGGASTDGTAKRRKSRSSEAGSESEWSGDDDVLSSDGNDDGDDVIRVGSLSPVVSSSATLLDGDFLEWTNGRPLPLTDRAKAVFHMSVLNVCTCVCLLFVLFVLATCLILLCFRSVVGYFVPFHYQCSGLLHFGGSRRGEQGARRRHY